MKKSLIVLAMLACLVPLSSAHGKGLNPDAPVLVIKDITVRSGCTSSTKVNDVLIEAGPCRPGSVFQSYTTTLGEVQRKGIQSYLLLTGNWDVDQAAKEALVQRSKAASQGASVAPVTTSSCFVTSVTKSGSFTPLSGQPKVNYDVKYTRTFDCAVSNIEDRGKMSSTPSKTVKWFETVAGGLAILRDSPSNGRTLATSWTGWRSFPWSLSPGSGYQFHTRTDGVETWGETTLN